LPGFSRFALLLIFRPFALPMAWRRFSHSCFSVEYSIAAPPEAQIIERRRADRSGAGRDPAAIERAVVEFVSQISVLLRQLQKSATDMDIKSFSDLPAVSLDRQINTWLQAHASISASRCNPGWSPERAR